MQPSRALPAAIAVGAVAVASMFAAAPAAAATLPPGQKISVIDSWSDQFYNVNPTSALGTPVGTPDTIDEYVTGVDVDDAGHGYAVATQTYWPSADVAAAVVLPYSNPLDGYVDGGWLYKADANTGKLSDGKPVIISSPEMKAEPADECSAIDYSAGVIVAVCYTYDWYEPEPVPLVEEGDDAPPAELIEGYWDVTTYIGTVDASDPDQAVLTALTTLLGDGYKYFAAIAKNPIDGKIIGFDWYFNESYYITLDDEYPEYIDDLEDYQVWGADYDRGGQLWLTVVPFRDGGLAALAFESYFSLATYNFITGQPVLVNSFSSELPYQIALPESITIWGALAATGSTISVAPAVAASGILLLGALLAAGTMVLRRRNADA